MVRQSQPQDQPVVLLTRPEPGAATTAAALRRAVAAVPILFSPLMTVEYLRPLLPPVAFLAVIFTSRAGVAAALRLRDAGATLPQRAYAVGDATAAAAQAAGFQAHSAQGDAAALLRLILQDHPDGPLLHLCGQDAGIALAEGLLSAGIETHAAIAYAQCVQPMTRAAKGLLTGRQPVILPLFSPRSAELFLRATSAFTVTAPLDLVTLSGSVSHAASAIPSRHQSIARQPTEAAMVLAVANRLRQKPDLIGTAPDH